MVIIEYKFPYKDWTNSTPEITGKFTPTLPVKNWMDPRFAGSKSFATVKYWVINSKDATKDPFPEEIQLPEFIAGAYNVPSQEWSVTNRGDLEIIPIPLSDDFVEKLKDGEYAFKWKGNAIEVIEPKKLLNPMTPREFTQGDHEVLVALKVDTEKIKLAIATLLDRTNVIR